MNGEKSLTKLVFFDVDGVLSVPRYHMDGRMTIGTTSEKWIAYCRIHGQDTYEYCTGVGPVRAYAEKRKREGARLFVLSAVACEEEERAKDRFIERLYPGLPVNWWKTIWTCCLRPILRALRRCISAC